MSLDTQISVNYFDKSNFYFKRDEDGLLLEFDPFLSFGKTAQQLHANGYLSVDEMLIHCAENTSYGPSNMYGEQDTESTIYFSSANAKYTHPTLEEIVNDVFDTLSMIALERIQDNEDDKDYFGHGYYRPGYSSLTPPVNPSNVEEVALYEGRAPFGSAAYQVYSAPNNRIQFTQVTIDDYSPVLGEYFYTTVGYGYYSAYQKKYVKSDSSGTGDTRNFITTELMEKLKATAISEGRFYDPANHSGI